MNGCAEWLGEGLAQPEAVRAATAAYLAAEDALSIWIEERCAVNPNRYATAADLFSDWREYADKAGEPAGSQKRFCQALLDRGFTQRRQGGTGKMGFEGIGIRYLETASGATL